MSQHAWLFAISTLVAGCVTAPTFEKGDYYPTDWPSIGSVGEDCRGIEATFENKGVLVDEKGRSREVWFTDLWLTDPTYERRGEALKVYEAKLAPFRACERVSLKIEEFAHPARPLIPEAKWQLVINPTRSATGPPSQFEPCESLRVPAPNQPGIGLCTKNTFFYRESGGGSDYETSIGLASDGSLLVKVHHLHLGAVPPVVVFFWTDNAWARFSKLP
jgi:hypothetical protein